MDYIYLFIFEILLGYVVQSAGSIICLYAFSSKRIILWQFSLLTIINTVAVYIIRNIGIINFGIHTLLIMIVIILLGVFVLKASINSSVFAALITMVTVTVGEVITILFLNIFYDNSTIENILKSDQTMEGRINKAITVTPSNVIVIVVMVLLYIISRKRLKDKKGGEVSKTNS